MTQNTLTLTLEQIKAQYPDIYINDGSEPDSYRQDVPIVERDPIAVIIKHPTEAKYLIAKWKQAVWNGFLTGGIEDGDTPEDTVRKEIREETGYTHVGDIVDMHFVSHSLFFHIVKNVNRLAHYHLIVATLTDLDKDEVSEDEKAIAEFEWVDESEVQNILTKNCMKKLWGYYISSKNEKAPDADVSA